MRDAFVLRSSATILLVMGVANFLWIWILHRQWWQIRAVRRATWMVPLASFLLLAIWVLASSYGFTALAIAMSVVVSFVVICTVALAVSLPLSGILLTFERIVGWILRRGSRGEPSAVTAPAATAVAPVEVDQTRRSILTSAAAIIPVAFVASGAGGVANSFSDVEFPQIPLSFPNLHPDLEGLRILHLTDVHLGYYVSLDDLERTLIAAEAQRADLVLVTGDLSDDLTVLDGALSMIGQFKTRYGTFASIGNHEYYRGVEEFLAAFERSSFPLLRESGTTLRIGAADLHLLGADDPASDRDNPPGREAGKRPFLERSVRTALDGAPSEAFTLLMSHRPEAFEAAARNGIDLTLSGHTHGGLQMGFNGRGLFEKIVPENYLWGHYQKGESQLYTSAGVGHWFPFRLGVPCEAPVYTLRRG